MNNEEKILELLAELKTGFAEIKTDVAEIKTDVAELQTDVTGIKTDVARIKTDVAELQTDVAGLKTNVAGIKTDVAGIKTDVAELKTDVTGLKTDVAGLKTDVTSIKATLDKHSELLAELDERSLRSAVTLENLALPRLQALYEGHGAIMERLETRASKSRMEALEDDMAMMKDSLKLLRIEVNELKKAE